MADAWRSAGGPKGRSYHPVLEAPGRRAQDFQLELLLGAKVGEQPALGHGQCLGEPADAQALEPIAAGHAEGPLENALARLVPFGHGPYLRTFVLFVKPKRWSTLPEPARKRRLGHGAACR